MCYWKPGLVRRLNIKHLNGQEARQPRLETGVGSETIHGAGGVVDGAVQTWSGS